MKEKYIKSSSRKRISGVDLRRTILTGLALTAVLVLSSGVGSAFISSQNVLVINKDGPDPACGVGSCSIIPADYIGGPFNVPSLITMDQITRSAFPNAVFSAGGYDTVILFGVDNSKLLVAQTSALLSFVTGGGKLIIKDADAVSVPNGIPTNNYNWLPPVLQFSTSGPGPGGQPGLGLSITETNDLTSGLTPADITALNTGSDATGDANVITTNGTDWCEDLHGTNKPSIGNPPPPPTSGPIHMYSRLGGAAGSGIILYAAFDNDAANSSAGNSFISWNGVASSLSGGNQLKEILQSELTVNNNSNLPCKVPVVPPHGSIAGMKFNDLNGNGINDAEPGLVGWTITLTNESGGVVTNVTDTNGNYNFTGLADGNYTVGEVLQVGWTQTAPQPVPPGTYTVNLSAGENVIGKDFGNIRTPIASCNETVNPAGKNVPPAGSTTLPGSKGGQNEDGFYELQANNPLAEIFVKDIGSGTIFPLAPPGFSPGTKIKYTEANGATPSIKNIGGPNSAVDWHITGTGDAAVYAVVGIVKGPEVVCKVPPPPK